ncbi:MAG TPA: hypothetical protein VGL92_02835, partial [Acidimicrobiia bacterium]
MTRNPTGSHQKVEERLRAAGHSPAPEPRAAFAEALDDRLRTIAGVEVTDPVATPPRPRRARHWTALGLLAGASAAVVAGVLVAVSGVGDGHEVRVATATDTLVVLPDGTVDTVDPGLLVPDGSRIVTLDEGRVVAGDVELGPDREGVVDQGALRPTPTTAPRPAPVAQPEPPAVTRPTSPPATSPPPTPGPQPVEPQPVEPQPKPAEPAPGTKPDPAATEPGAPRVVALKLEALYKDTTVKLRWSAYTGPGFAAYLVLRSDAPAEPQYPLDEHTTVVARITDPATVQYFDAVREPAGRSYRVVAVDEGRRLLAQSPAVRPQPAATNTSTTSSQPVAVEPSPSP